MNHGADRRCSVCPASFSPPSAASHEVSEVIMRQCFLRAPAAVLFIATAFCAAAFAQQPEAAPQPTFLHPRYIIEIKVTAEQLEKLRAVEEKYAREIETKNNSLYDDQVDAHARFKERRDEVGKLRVALDEGIDALLTVDQRRRIRDERRTELRRDADLAAPFLRNIGTYTQTIAKADELVLYEGLPHQNERQLLEQEQRDKKIVEFDKFPFYAETMMPRPTDADRLREIGSDYRSFRPYGGPKFCGGYHPDWGMEWTVDKQVYRLFICLGCHEGHFIGPESDLWVDLEETTWESFVDLFATYRKNRPRSESAAPKCE
jgi:hypothetical protein